MNKLFYNRFGFNWYKIRPNYHYKHSVPVIVNNCGINCGYILVRNKVPYNKFRNEFLDPLLESKFNLSELDLKWMNNPFSFKHIHIRNYIPNKSKWEPNIYRVSNDLSKQYIYDDVDRFWISIYIQKIGIFNFENIDIWMHHKTS